MTVISKTEERRPGLGWPREVAPHDLDQYGLRITSVLAPVPGAAPTAVTALARRCWQVLCGPGRPMGVLEVAARTAHPPITVVIALTELLRGGWVRKVMPPVAPESGRLRALTDGRPSPRLFHDLWLFVSGDPEHGLSALGGLCPQGVMRIAAEDAAEAGQGSLWLGAMADATAYVSLVAACGLGADSEHWPWLTHSACGAVLVADGHHPEACAPLVAALSRHGVPTVVLVDTGRCTSAPGEAQVRRALGTRTDTPVVFGRAGAASDVDEALRDLEEHLHLKRAGLALQGRAATTTPTPLGETP